ncbi:hypothetical protein [Rhizomonospora bruguierae]|uniref:hypothetical protein n=1 Tax=Rhizomonospora bruguierae TaxID=1581705 RepID=UPI001BCF858F|nr:hypothetical protein [Micromonospora sp. NBRC 107566]
MTEPEESRAKTTETDGVLMHPGNHPDTTTAQVKGPPESGETRVEVGGEMVRVRVDQETRVQGPDTVDDSEPPD